MTYAEALDFMYSQLPMFHRIGKEAYKNNLDNTLALDEYFSHPHKHFQCIHVAGTNGKGSTSHCLASILQSAGYKTGLYTSPHLVDFRERIRINGEKIPENKVISFINDHKQILTTLKPSFFEMTVAMAFDFFRNERIDVAIIEVGMGGRLDSTNIITPVLSIITNISYDHKQFLGDTLPKIAAEKAGIIKAGVPIIIGERNPESEDVFCQAAAEKKAPISFASDFVKVKQVSLSQEPNDISTYSLDCDNERQLIACDLLGNYQEKNIQTVYSAFLQLQKLFSLNRQNFQDGLGSVKNNTGLAGRWEIIQTKPLTICDTGHNEAGITQNILQIQQYSYRKLLIVFGAVNDKEIDAILALLPRDAKYYFVQASIPRALDSLILLEKAKRKGLEGIAFSSVHEGFEYSVKEAGDNDLIFVGGSTFVVADLLVHLTNKKSTSIF